MKYVIIGLCFLLGFAFGDDSVCTTKECYRISKQLQSYMNFSVNPCDDFFHYACGNFGKQVGENRDSYDLRREDVPKEINVAIQSMVTSNVEFNSTAIKFFVKLYQGCNQTDPRGLQPLIEAIDQTIGGWPLLGKVAKAKGNWTQQWARLVSQLKISPFLELNLFKWPRNDSFSLEINPVSGGLPREIFHNHFYEDTVEAYRKYIHDSALLFGAKNDDNLTHSVADIVELERTLAKIRSFPLGKSYNLKTLNSLMKGNFNWTQVLNQIRVETNATRSPWIDSDLVYVNDDGTYLIDVVKVFSQANPITVQNFFGWLIVEQYGRLTTKEFRAIEQTFRKQLNKDDVLDDSIINTAPCTDLVRSKLPHIVDRAYLDRFFTGEVEQQAERLVLEIRNAFAENLRENFWLDEVTRLKALEKLNVIQAHLAGPDWLRNDSYLDRLYDFVNQVDLVPSHFLESLFHMQRVAMREVMDFAGTTEEFSWKLTTLTVNADFLLSLNIVEVPAPMFRPPFFDVSRPYVMNYAQLGSIIGHEFTHGFDVGGRLWDKNGERHNWWTKETLEKFKNLTQCFVHQYSIYDEYSDAQLNGTRTLNENIADNGGLKEGFRAFRNHAKSDSHPPSILPDLKLTAEQLYFLANANTWCNSYSAQYEKAKVESKDVHTTDRYRALIPLSNSADFAKAFKCPLGSKMNPVQKCAVW